MSYDPRQVAFIDTETTGLDPERDRIWQVAVIVDDTEHLWQQRLPVGSFGWYADDMDDPWDHRHTLWTPDSWVLANTSIRTSYDHATALDPHESIERFCNLTRGRHLVGACPWFDSERLHRVHLAATPVGNRQHPWHYHLIDVETLIVGWAAGVLEQELDPNNAPLPQSPPLPWDSRALSRAVGVDPDKFGPAHDALHDARWAKACFEAVVGRPA